MAKQKTINDVVHELQEVNKSLDALLQVERREARLAGGGAGGAGSHPLSLMLSDIKGRMSDATSVVKGLAAGFKGVLKGVGKAVIGIGVRSAIQLDRLIVETASSGRDLGAVIESLEDEKISFLGGMTNNALMQIAALRQGFDLQDTTLREQLTVLEKDAGQGQVLLAYTNQLLKHGMRREQGEKLLQNFADLTQTSIQSGDTLVQVLGQLGGFQAALTSMGLGFGAQEALSKMTKGMPVAQAIEVAKQFKDLMFTPSEMAAAYAQSGGQNASDIIEETLKNIELEGESTPEQINLLLNVLSQQTTAQGKFYSTFTDLAKGNLGLVAGRIMESDVVDLERITRMAAVKSGIDFLRGVRDPAKERGQEQFWKTSDQHLKALSTSLAQVGNLWQELILRGLSKSGGEHGRDLFGGMFESLEDANRSLQSGVPMDDIKLPGGWDSLWEMLGFFTGNFNQEEGNTLDLGEEAVDLFETMIEWLSTISLSLNSMNTRDAAREGEWLPDRPNSGDTPQLA